MHKDKFVEITEKVCVPICECVCKAEPCGFALVFN